RRSVACASVLPLPLHRPWRPTLLPAPPLFRQLHSFPTRRSSDLHVGFQHLRRVVLAEHKRNMVLKPVLLSLLDDLWNLLERTEHHHAGSVFLTSLWLFL